MLLLLRTNGCWGGFVKAVRKWWFKRGAAPSPEARGVCDCKKQHFILAERLVYCLSDLSYGLPTYPPFFAILAIITSIYFFIYWADVTMSMRVPIATPLIHNFQNYIFSKSCRPLHIPLQSNATELSNAILIISQMYCLSRLQPFLFIMMLQNITYLFTVTNTPVVLTCLVSDCLYIKMIDRT